MIIHLPHSSRFIPAEYLNQFVVSEQRLQHEMNVMVDSFTDELFGFNCAAENVRTIVFPFCRLLVDPERFADDSLEAMSKKGMGVLYSKTYKGEPLRRRLDEEERRDLLEKYYFPHQKSVSDAVSEELKKSGSSLVLDGHSFPSRPLPCHDDQTEPTPDFCLGTDSFHTPKKLTETIERKIKKLGYTVEINRPFAGAFVPSAYYKKDKQVAALMIEVNRRLYMDEESATKSENFNRVQKHIKELLSEANGWLQSIEEA
ncbi:MAG TPA: N-formylglutamate amidohydrolase [Pyrinomonadaceae bacterium]|nr:N-formylglutamate amidohydrolase [Pyrinomonadaceae bacterium]